MAEGFRKTEMFLVKLKRPLDLDHKYIEEGTKVKAIAVEGTELMQLCEPGEIIYIHANDVEFH